MRFDNNPDTAAHIPVTDSHHSPGNYFGSYPDFDNHPDFDNCLGSGNYLVPDSDNRLGSGSRSGFTSDCLFSSLPCFLFQR